jgi:hypothetical protein
MWPEHRVTETTALFRDIALRLERTPARKALIYPFDSQQAARRARKNVSTMFRARMGGGRVSLSVTDYNGKPALWVRRGPQWGANGVPVEDGEGDE